MRMERRDGGYVEQWPEDEPPVGDVVSVTVLPTYSELLIAAGRPLQALMVADVSDKVKHHVHEALHHMTVAVLELAMEEKD